MTNKPMGSRGPHGLAGVVIGQSNSNKEKIQNHVSLFN